MTLNEIEYRRRKDNTDFLENAISVVEADVKKRIRKIAVCHNHLKVSQITSEMDSYTAILTGLTGVWTESLIKYIIQENGAFNLTQINHILTTKSLIGKWESVYKGGLTNKYGIPTSRSHQIASKSEIQFFFNSDSVNQNRFNNTFQLIETILDDVVNLRNKIQHGEWLNGYSKDSHGNYFFDSNIIMSSNVLVQRLRRNQIKQLFLILSDLCTFKHSGKFRIISSSNPYEYFFPKRNGQILKLQNEIDIADINKYINGIMEKERRASYWKRKNRSPITQVIKCIRKLNNQ